MRILHLLASPVFSGPAEGVRLLALAQRQAGHQVHVAIDRKRGGLGSEEPSAPRFAELGLLDEHGLELSTHSSPRALFRDVRALRRCAVDVLHAHFSHDHWISRLGRPRGAILVRSIHAPRSLGVGTPRADAWTVPFEALLSAVRPPAIVLPALVDPVFRPAVDVAAQRQQLGLTGAPLIGMVSTFQESRRHSLALTAFARVREQRPGAQLVLVGDGALGAALREQVQRLGLQSAVRFIGYRSGAAFVEYLQTLDEVWILGLGNDWSARAALQARACGVRVVAVAEGALPRWSDAQVEALTPEAVAAASASDARQTRALPGPDKVAAAVLALYVQAGVRA